MMSARRSIAAARSAGAQCAQPCGSSKAPRAASTAASTSDSFASGTEPIVASVLAETTVIRPAERGAAHRPPISNDS